MLWVSITQMAPYEVNLHLIREQSSVIDSILAVAVSHPLEPQSQLHLHGFVSPVITEPLFM